MNAGPTTQLAMRYLSFLFFTVWSCTMALADDAKGEKQAPPPASETKANATDQRDLKRIYGSLINVVDHLNQLELGKSQEEEIKQMRDNIQEIVAGSQVVAFEQAEEQSQSIQNQILEILKPVLSSLRSATSQPREMDQLRTDLQMWNERETAAEIVLQRIADLRKLDKDGKLKAELSDVEKQWKDKKTNARAQQSILQTRIDEMVRAKKPIWDTVSHGIADFFRTRGLNLLLALIAGVLGFILVRKGYSFFRKYSPVHRGKSNLTTRISDILATATAVVVSLLCCLLVFYARGDWLLLTLAAILVFGAVWASKTALPPYVAQIRMLLNLGSVREGERVTYLGVPWRVKSLGFLTDLENPNLQGGHVRMPIKNLLDMISREADEKEPWFPCEQGQWVLMPDGTHGKVIIQTPEQTVLLKLGGSITTYSTPDFLSALPENLSNGFRINSIFGIDYEHQKDVVEKIPQIMAAHLEMFFTTKYGRDEIRSIKVEFASAGASSLDFEVLADFSGELAPRYGELRRALQRECVALCNEHGWVIPFTQITVHQAGNAQG